MMRARGARSRLALLSVLTASAAVLAGCGAGGPSLPRDAPALVGVDFSGTSRDLDDLRGSVVLVTVWASWCTPCREEAPVIQSTYEQLHGKDFAVLGVDFRDNPVTAQAFVDEVGAGYPNIADLTGAASVEWGVSAIPQSFIVDRDGSIVAHSAGPVTSSWLEQHLLPLVDG